MKIRILGALCLFVLMTAFSVPAAAQDTGIWVVDEKVDAVFRDHITFEVSLGSDQLIENVSLLYKVESIGLSVTSRGDAEFDPGTAVTARFTIDQEKDYLPPGSVLEYWWKIEDTAGSTLTTDHQTFTYLDERREWQSLTNARLSLFWYKGDEDFGQSLFDRANETLDQIELEAGVQVEMPIKIFIYGSHSDLMNAIDVGAQEWTGGLAFTEQGVIVLGVAARDLDFALVALPHELTHLVIHQATDNPFGGLPTWLDEGLAVYMSGEIDASWRGYRELVRRQVKNNELISLQTLSSSFPSDPDEAMQSYAQSGLVVEYIIDQFGTEAMSDLLGIFAEGSTYDDALTQALNLDTWGLDNAWRENIGASQVSRPGDDSAPVPAVERPAEQADAGEVSEREPETGVTAETNPDPASQFVLPCLGSLFVAILALLALWAR